MHAGVSPERFSLYLDLYVKHAGDVNADKILRSLRGLSDEEVKERVRRTYYTYDYRTHYNARSCGNPGIPKKGQSWVESTAPGAIVVHNCYPGYTLVGPKLRVCESSGKWNPPTLPKCVCEFQLAFQGVVYSMQ